MSADDGLTAKDRLHEALEPLSQNAFVYPEGEALIASIAISLKRIADAVAPTEGRSAIDRLDEVLTDFTSNIYSALINARS